eukprot:scaffold189355_cov27-Tisochrysis_lutea.AAC.2
MPRTTCIHYARAQKLAGLTRKTGYSSLFKVWMRCLFSPKGRPSPTRQWCLSELILCVLHTHLPLASRE